MSYSFFPAPPPNLFNTSFVLIILNYLIVCLLYALTLTSQAGTVGGVMFPPHGQASEFVSESSSALALIHAQGLGEILNYGIVYSKL